MWSAGVRPFQATPDGCCAPPLRCIADLCSPRRGRIPVQAVVDLPGRPFLGCGCDLTGARLPVLRAGAETAVNCGFAAPGPGPGGAAVTAFLAPAWDPDPRAVTFYLSAARTRRGAATTHSRQVSGRAGSTIPPWSRTETRLLRSLHRSVSMDPSVGSPKHDTTARRFTATVALSGGAALVSQLPSGPALIGREWLPANSRARSSGIWLCARGLPVFSAGSTRKVIFPFFAGGLAGVLRCGTIPLQVRVLGSAFP